MRKIVTKLTSKNIAINNIQTSSQSGFSLIEIMIAAIILSIGILGVAGLQVVGMKGTHQSSMKQYAVEMIHNLTERMQANKQGVIDGFYQVPSTYNCGTETIATSCNSSSSNCSSEDIAKIDINNLVCGYQVGSGVRTGSVNIDNASDIAVLANGNLVVTCPDAAGCSTGNVRINLSWDEQAIGNEGPQNDFIVINTRVVP